EMGILERIMVLLRQGTSAALAPAPDPRVTHLTSHQKQRALLNQVAKAGKEVTAAKERLRAAADAVRAKLPAMEEQARQELQARATAIDRLVQGGDLDAISFGTGSDAIDRRYQSLGADEDVERQLDALRQLNR